MTTPPAAQRIPVVIVDTIQDWGDFLNHPDGGLNVGGMGLISLSGVEYSVGLVDGVLRFTDGDVIHVALPGDVKPEWLGTPTVHAAQPFWDVLLKMEEDSPLILRPPPTIGDLKEQNARLHKMLDLAYFTSERNRLAVLDKNRVVTAQEVEIAKLRDELLAMQVSLGGRETQVQQLAGGVLAAEVLMSKSAAGPSSSNAIPLASSSESDSSEDEKAKRKSKKKKKKEGKNSLVASGAFRVPS